MISQKEYWPFFLVTFVCVGLAMIVPASKHNFYIIGLLTSACLWAVYIVSWDLLAGYTGMLNFGQLLFAGVAAYTVALIELNSSVPHVIAITAGVVTGTCSSLLMGLPSLRVRSAYFALVSFALLLVFYRITLTFVKVFGGDYGLSMQRVFSRESLCYSSIILMAITLIAMRFLVKSRIGIALQCIRQDEETARAVGINIARYKLIACIVSAFFTSLAGICSFYYMGHIGPEIFGLVGSFNVAIMGVIGGMGTIYGAALGGWGLTMLLEIIRPIAEYRTILYSVFLVVVVMLAPGGAWGGIDSFLRKRLVGKELSDAGDGQ
jgi:branched-chain amino acid transport system permease protein